LTTPTIKRKSLYHGLLTEAILPVWNVRSNRTFVVDVPIALI